MMHNRQFTNGGRISLEHMRKSAIVGFLALCVSIIGTTFGATNVLFEKFVIHNLKARHDIEIKSLNTNHGIELDKTKSRFSSIDIGLNENEYIDIRKLIITNPLTTKISNDKKRVDEYLYVNFDEKVWRYRNDLSGAELTTYILGEKNKIALMNKNMSKAFGMDSKIHMWHGDIMKAKENPVIDRIFPYIASGRTRMSDLLVVVDRAIEMAEGITASKNKKETKSYNASIVETIKEDILRFMMFGSYLTDMLFKQEYPNVKFSTIRLQIINENSYKVLYYKSKMEIPNIEIGDRRYQRYYIIDDVILIATNDYLYEIRMSVPNDEQPFRNQYFALVKEWLFGARFLINS
jgi:hypothetical protein